MRETTTVPHTPSFPLGAHVMAGPLTNAEQIALRQVVAFEEIAKALREIAFALKLNRPE
jgi:hypothetical protein